MSKPTVPQRTASLVSGGLGALAILLGKAAVASACTQAPYEDVFVPSGTVPVDAFAAEIGDPDHSMPALVDDAGATIDLVTTPGPATRWTVRPARALVPGANYTFRYQLARRFDATDTVPQSVELTAGPSAPTPEAAGTLQVQADPLDSATSTQTLHLQWDRSPALQAYASLLEIHFMVDGKIVSPLAASQMAGTLSAMCGATQPTWDSCGDVWTVPGGHHTFTVSARLFGSAEPLPPPTATIDVCARPTPTPLGGDTAGPDMAGCAVAGDASGSALTALAGAVVSLALALGRRERRE